MAKVKTSELIGPALDWAVAIALGFEVRSLGRGIGGRIEAVNKDYFGSWGWNWFGPSTDSTQGHPILERNRINFKNDGLTSGAWWACKPEGRFHQSGPTMLIAGLRCWVTSKLGDEVDVPDELVKDKHDLESTRRTVTSP